jgi:hypothetical protein
MKRIYLCGPITGLPLDNRPAFDKAVADVTIKFKETYQQVEVINPHVTCADIVRQHKGTPKHLWEKCMKADITEMLKCDMVVLLPGWQNSRGATLERTIAMNLGIPVWSIDELLA